uniref:protein-tyrosine-phosphatase n=1 Tax=Oryzias latipes TaxID=8090 RepID=A0A3B3IJ25_ORYLA
MSVRSPHLIVDDHSRVRLSIQNQDPGSDYINANFVPVRSLTSRLIVMGCWFYYSCVSPEVITSLCLCVWIQGGGSERDFICTQGPLQNTLPDFWRMVWEQNVRIIVMVTSLKQKHTVRPLFKTLHSKDGILTEGLSFFLNQLIKKELGFIYFFITTINLQGNPNDRIITHYYYPTWPDQDVPLPSSLCVFTEHVRQHLEATPCLGPAVVHCSAGVGRSGTFVTLLWLMQLCMRGIQPNIKAAVEDLRLHRMYMVQTPVGQFYEGAMINIHCGTF